MAKNCSPTFRLGTFRTLSGYFFTYFFLPLLECLAQTSFVCSLKRGGLALLWCESPLTNSIIFSSSSFCFTCLLATVSFLAHLFSNILWSESAFALFRGRTSGMVSGKYQRLKRRSLIKSPWYARTRDLLIQRCWKRVMGLRWFLKLVTD